MGTEELSDEQLLARLIDRDTNAFATLYDRHSRMAFGLAYRMLGESSAAEDVVQEAFLHSGGSRIPFVRSDPQ